MEALRRSIRSLHAVSRYGLRERRDEAADKLRVAEQSLYELQRQLIPKLGALKSLVLWETEVTDAGMRHLAGLGLRSLNLSYTKVGDKGAGQLSKIRSLRKRSMSSSSRPSLANSSRWSI